MARSGIKQKSAARPARRKSRKISRRRASAPAANEAVLAVFAHDIRTALTGILALGELLASSNLGERERRWAFGITTSAQHLASLFEGHGSQIVPRCTRKPDRRTHVEPFGRRLSQDFPRSGVHKRRLLALADAPLILEVALNHGHVVCLSKGPSAPLLQRSSHRTLCF